MPGANEGAADGTFLTVAGRGHDEFSVRGSEFVGYAAPAHAVEAAEAFVDEIRAAHPEATHVVPAYRVRDADGEFLREYASDEDEPSGSAGKPALNVLERRDLEDVAVAVVRYFGGTELGVGVLARAYARAVSLAVDAAGVVESVPHEPLAVVVEYDDSGTVRGILESEEVDFEAEYAERVRFDARVPSTGLAGLVDRVESATSGRAEIARSAAAGDGSDARDETANGGGT